MPDEPPSILPRGTGTRRPLSPSPALPGSAVNIQSVVGFSCIAGGAIGRAEISGGRSPASMSATRHAGSSDRRDAITAPAEPPPTTMKSNCSAMTSSLRYAVDIAVSPKSVELRFCFLKVGGVAALLKSQSTRRPPRKPRLFATRPRILWGDGLTGGGRWIRTFGSQTRHQAVRPRRGRFSSDREFAPLAWRDRDFEPPAPSRVDLCVRTRTVQGHKQKRKLKSVAPFAR